MKNSVTHKFRKLKLMMVLCCFIPAMAMAQTPYNNESLMATGSADDIYGFTNTLKSFSVTIYENVAYIKWAVKGEKSECIYAIERSEDGSNFTTIAYKDGIPTTNRELELMYTTKDAAPLASVSYYRLKQVKQDGIIYSHSVSVFNNNGNFATKK